MTMFETIAVVVGSGLFQSAVTIAAIKKDISWLKITTDRHEHQIEKIFDKL